ncbi:MAG: hypothetical protein RML36_17015 [Anaerolineae bacterium]|nr:hypothetical protein [Anaerolineae bacterium]
MTKMEDVLDVYQRPYDPKRPIVGLDEASKRLHATPCGRLPLEPGQSIREDHKYERRGVANLFRAIEPLRGCRKVRGTARRTVENLNTHGPGALDEAFGPEEAYRLAARFEWHYTPEHGRWLNIAECELAVLATQCLGQRIPDTDTLIREVTAWEARRNNAHAKMIWQFTTADTGIKLRRLYPVVKEQNLSLT